MPDNIAFGTCSVLRKTVRCSKSLQWFHKSCENILEDEFDYEDKALVLLDMYISRSRTVLHTFFEVFSCRLNQICNILARTVLVIEVANKRFQQKL